MRIGRILCGVGLFSCALFSSSHLVSAQNANDRNNRHQPRYKLIDLGTLGGPISYGSVSGDGFRLLNNDGVVTSFADTSKPDPNAPNFCFDSDCLLAHGFRWKDGIITDLGALPGVNNSAAGAINERGWIAGSSQTGFVDPVLGPAIHGSAMEAPRDHRSRYLRHGESGHLHQQCRPSRRHFR